MALAEGFVCHGITFDYGQRHRVEIDAAKRVAGEMGVASHRICKIDLRAIGGSSLTDGIDVPKDRPLEAMSEGGWNILIRTFVCAGERSHVHVGAGIVADSEPEREYEETLTKAAALLDAAAMGSTPIEKLASGVP
jgi:hypothetical protein